MTVLNQFSRTPTPLFTKHLITDTNQVMYLPAWHPFSKGSPFTTRDKNKYSVTVTEAVWGIQGYTLDGSNDKLVVGDTTTFKWLHGADDTTAFQFTLHMVVKFANWTTRAGLICTGDPATALVVGANWGIVNGTAINLSIYNGIGGQAVIATSWSSGFNLSTNIYYLLSVTYDQALASGNAALYINGSLIGLKNKGANTPSTSNSGFALTIGFGQTTPWLYLAGTIAEVAILKRAQSAAEVKNFYLSAKRRLLYI